MKAIHPKASILRATAERATKEKSMIASIKSLISMYPDIVSDLRTD